MASNSETGLRKPKSQAVGSTQKPDPQDIANNPENITFDYSTMSKNLKNVADDINARLKETDIKLTSLKGKEDILNKIITSTNMLLERTDPSNFKLVGVYQNQIMVQLESFGLLQEAIMKYEDLAQRYIKMQIDIENNKLNSFAKIKALYKTNDTADEGYDKLLKNMHELVHNPNQVLDLQAEALNQLNIAGY